jgi:signal transduction histidine kinase
MRAGLAAGRYTRGSLTMVWDAHTGRIVKRLPGPANNHVTFSPDGRWLFIAGTNGAALWSTGAWERRWLQPRPAMPDTQSVGCFTGDSNFIAWSCGVTRVDLMDLEGKPVAGLDFPELGYVAGLRYAAGARKLFVSGMEGRLLTVDLAALRHRLAGMNLDWTNEASVPPPPRRSPAPSGPAVWPPALLGIVPVMLAGVLGVLVLRRQGRLTREFIHATEVVSQRGQALAAEKEVSELKSRFVNTVSHEFRTPLGIAMSAVELLRHYEDRLPQEEKTQLFDDIHTATKNMAGLMELVLVLGRVDAGKLAFKPVPCDLEVIVRKLIDESLSATNRKSPIHWTAENDLSGSCAGEALLRHIFTNLLNNAVKYSAAGSPVHFSGRREGPVAVFNVQDHGIGIPEADLPTLFEAFHRASNVGGIPGTGLGLVISKRCAELHGGSIEEHSETGTGTTFTVRLMAWA